HGNEGVGGRGARAGVDPQVAVLDGRIAEPHVGGRGAGAVAGGGSVGGGRGGVAEVRAGGDLGGAGARIGLHGGLAIHVEREGAGGAVPPGDAQVIGLAGARGDLHGRAQAAGGAVAAGVVVA